MTTKLVSIGNSKAVRLSKKMLDATGIKGSVSVQMENGALVIRPSSRRRKPRAGWAKAIQAETTRNGPPEIDRDWLDLPNAWDAEGWR